MTRRPMSSNGSRGPRLPSSHQLFAAVVLATACTVLVSCYASPNNIVRHAASAQSSALSRSDGQLVLVVGSLLECQGTEQLSLQQLTAAAAAQPTELQGSASRSASDGTAAVLSGAAGLVKVGCSMQLQPQPSELGKWQQGPYQQQQTLQVAGLDALNCIMQEEHSVAAAPYVFLLQNTGPAQARVIEYAQLPQLQRPSQQHISSDNIDHPGLSRLESWLSTDLPDSCFTALQPAAELEVAASHSRQLLQDASQSPSPSPSPSPTPDAAPSPSPSLSPSPSPAPSPAPPAAPQSPAPAAPGPEGSPAPSATPAANNTASVDASNATLAENDTSANSTALNGTLGNGKMSEDTARVVCALQPETGPCRAAFSRWAFDVQSQTCQQFVYGGCAGNANNFESPQDCEDACFAVMGVSNATANSTNAPSGPLAVTVDSPRQLEGGPAPPVPTSRAEGRSWGEQVLRVFAAGAVGALTILLL